MTCCSDEARDQYNKSLAALVSRHETPMPMCDRACELDSSLVLVHCYRAVAGDVTTVKHCNTFRTLNVIFRALSTSVWQKNGRLYSDI